MLTLSKIAKLANVSISTASKAFSMSPEVNEETREMIFDIAKRHGCFKKFFNAKYPKLVFAVICPEFESPYYSSFLAHMQMVLEKLGCETCVATTHFSKARGKELVDYYTRYARVDGIILIDAASALEAANDVPIVCIGWAKDPAVRVSMTHQEALTEAIDYFISKGVKEIGFIGEKLTSSKQNLFTEIMTDRLGGINPDFIGIGDRFSDGAYATTEILLKKSRPPRALICAYDYLAIGVIRCLYDHGYRVPEDVLVLGMDNIPEDPYLNPPLSSIAPNIDEVCEAAAKTLINIIMGRPYKNSTVIKSTLYLRRSTEVQ